MNLSHLILASLVTATTWAQVRDTHAFFAEVDGELKPLQVDFTYASGTLRWGDFVEDATEFHYQDGFATSSNNTMPGKILLSIESGIRLVDSDPATKLILEDKTNRLLNSFYYSCKSDHGNIISSHKTFDYCFLVDLYFVPYDRENRYPAPGSYQKADIVRQPHVFVAKGKNGYLPLYIENSNPSKWGLAFLHYGKSTVEPLEFFTQGDYAITEQGTNHAGYASFFKDSFSFSSVFGDHKLGLDEDGNVLARRFFLCEDTETGDEKIVLNPHTCTHWTETNVALVPYNRESKKPIIDPTVLFENENSSQYKFFFDTQDENDVNFKPVYFSREDCTAYTYRIQDGVETEFSLKNKIAYSEETGNRGFAGFIENQFTCNVLTDQTQFIGEGGLISNYEFYETPDHRIVINVPPAAGFSRINLLLAVVGDRGPKQLPHMPEDNERIPTDSSVPSMSVTTMSDISETSVNTMPNISGPLVSSMSDISETSVTTMSVNAWRSIVM